MFMNAEPEHLQEYYETVRQARIKLRDFLYNKWDKDSYLNIKLAELRQSKKIFYDEYGERYKYIVLDKNYVTNKLEIEYFMDYLESKNLYGDPLKGRVLIKDE